MKKILFSIITLMMVLVPLVNADEPRDENSYAIVENGDVNKPLGTNFHCNITNESGSKEKIKVECNQSMTIQLVDKNEDGTRIPGYWYGVVFKLPTDSYIKLDESTLTVGDTTYKNLNDIIDGEDDGKKWIGIWNKIDEYKKEKKEGQDTRTYTFNWIDKNNGSSYQQIITISINYENADKFTLSPSEEFYKVEVEVDADDLVDNEIIYIKKEEGNKTIADITDDLKKLMKDGYKIDYLEVDGEKLASESSYSTKELSTGESTKIKMVLKKISTSSGSTSTTTPDPEPTPEPEDNKPTDTNKDATPKTGNADLMGIASMMTLLSLVGIVKLKKSM